MPPPPVGRLATPAPPWVLRWAGDPRRLAAGAGLVVRAVPGAAGATRLGLLGRIAAELGFTSYFGLNWPALAQALADLGSFPGGPLVLRFDEADRVLEREPGERPRLLEVLDGAGSAWARHGRAFHAVLVAPTAAVWRVPELDG
jgi:hypothetical protein